jgi:hypothetical protein
MPTNRPRLVVTETDQLAHALNDAAERWPEDRGSRSKLLLRLVKAGHEAVAADLADQRAARSAAIRQTSGVLSGSYEPGYLDRLREDWPA